MAMKFSSKWRAYLFQFLGVGGLLIFTTIQMILIAAHPAWWMIGILGMFSLLYGQWEFLQQQMQSHGSTYQHLQNHYLKTIASSAILIIIAIFGIQSTWQWDITSNDQTTLSKQSIALLAQLDEGLMIRAYFEPKSSEQLAFQKLLQQAAQHQENITIQWLSTKQNPIKAKQDEVEHDHTVIFEYQSQHYRLEMDLSDHGLHRILKQILQQQPPLICFSQDFQELTWDYSDALGIGKTLEYLEAHQYTPYKVSLEIPESWKDCMVMVIAGPQKPLNSLALEQMDAILQKQHLLLMVDPNTQPDVTTWLSKYDLSLPNNLLLESHPNWQIQGTDPSFMKILPNPNHNAVLILQGIRNIEMLPPSESSMGRNQALLQSHATSFISTFPFKNSLEWNDPILQESMRSYPMMTLHQSNNRKSELLILGTSSLIWNQFVEQNPANAHFFKQVLDHLMYEATLNFTEDSQSSSILISPSQSVLMWIFTLFVVPGILLITAWLTWKDYQQSKV